MNKLNTLTEQTFKEFLLDIPSVCKNLSIEYLCKYRPDSTFPFINVCSCKIERYYFTWIITKKMKLESMTPTHSTLATSGKSSKDLVKIPSYIVTNRNHRIINERYTSIFTKGIECAKADTIVRLYWWTLINISTERVWTKDVALLVQANYWIYLR